MPCNNFFEHQDTPEQQESDSANENSEATISTAMVDFVGTTAQDTAYLAVLTGPNAGEVIRICGKLTIGRGANAGLRLADKKVSRLHVTVSMGPAQCISIHDQGSANGTFVGSRRIDRAQLKDGESFRIGDTTLLKFSHAGVLTTMRPPQQQQQQQQQQSIVRDPLTGLYSKYYLQKRIALELEGSVPQRIPPVIAIFEIDHFDDMLTTYGEEVAQELLNGVARRIATRIRGQDVVARIGNQQFGLLCLRVPLHVGQKIVKRVWEAIGEDRLIRSRPHCVISVSVGLATLSEDDERSVQQLFRHAEEALQHARCRCGGCIVTFEDVRSNTAR